MREQRDVLVIEDDAVVGEAARRILEPQGLSLDLAADADAGARRLEERSYRIVLCDLMLPDSSGFELIRRARSQSRAAEVIVITGYATVENAVRSFRLGVFDFVPKPFDFEELWGVVSRGLKFRRAAENGGVKALPEPSAQPRHVLGRHAWAMLETDGSAVIGVAETFPGMLERIAGVELPEARDHTTQGKCCARIRAGAARVHQVWAPLSGQVIAINERLTVDAELIDTDPYGAGWLLRIVPSNLEEELRHLTLR